MDSAFVRERQQVLRHSSLDAILVLLSLAHGAALLTIPSIPLIAIGLWWSANTIAHNFIHLPFFRSPSLNRVYSAYLSLVLGIPQSLWRRRHLAHHAGRAPMWRLTVDLAAEGALVIGLWTTLAIVVPVGFLSVYLPGWLIGLGLCQLQGHYEHAGGTTSHYGRLYNALFFNDGYHVEHHARPSAHWSRLKNRRQLEASVSRWPPVLRWLDSVGAAARGERAATLGATPAFRHGLLDGLERLVLASAVLQRFVLDRHERAFRKMLVHVGELGSITIVGGGLFPRTALVLSRLAPRATLTIVDADACHLELARCFLGDSIALKREVFDPRRPVMADLVVVPLAYVGDRSVFYTAPPARIVLVHDWIWSSHSRGVVVSWLLLKRLNLVLRREAVGALTAIS